MARPPKGGFRAAGLPPQGRQRADKAPPGAARAAEVGRLLQRGMTLQKSGQLWQAHECYQAVLERDPGHPDALHLLAIIALEAMRVAEATDMLKRAVARKPADPVLRGSYAEALLRGDDPISAERQLRRAAKLAPDNAEILCKLARALARLGREDDASAYFESVLASNPHHASALIGYADLCVQLGNAAKGQEIYRRAIDLKIEPARALAGLADCGKFQGNPPELREIDDMLAEPGVKAANAIRLCQAAAKICNAIGGYDDEFRYYISAKRMLGPDYDRVDFAQRHQLVKSVFAREFLAARADYGNASQKPVFIVGMPRSGTTLVEQIITSHPRAAGAGELGELQRIATTLGFGADDAEFARRVGGLKAKEAAALADESLVQFARFSNSAARITDKLPHNFQALGLAPLIFPNARIIHCRRNPLDTCVSCFLTPLKDSHSYARDLGGLGAYYREYVRLMDHWRDVLPMPILDVDYEAVVADTEAEARRMIAFIGLDWDPACLDYHDNRRAVHTISRSQVRQPIYNSSIGRWHRYEKHLGPLRAALGDLVH